MSFVVVSAYTRNTPYEAEVQNLRRSLEQLELPYELIPYNSVGNWAANTKEPYRHLRRWLDDNEGLDLLWVDADAVFHRYPDAMDTFTADFGAHYHKGLILNTATMVFNNNQASRLLLDKLLHRFNTPEPELSDQDIMKEVVEQEERSGGLTVLRLGPEYAKIFDYADTKTVDPVIEQFQASRRCKAENWLSS